MAAEPPVSGQRSLAKQAFEQGNWRDAYDIVRPLVLSPEGAGRLLADDFRQAIQCLQNLERHHEIDAFIAEAVDAHPQDWRLLAAAAESYRYGVTYGFLVGGEFQRGPQRGGGEYVTSSERDRVLALRLIDRARQQIDTADESAADRGAFYRQLADTILWQRDDTNAWRLQDLTDLAQLPDYETGYRGWGWRGDPGQGAPVDADGQPVLHHVPESWEAATSDGQRWRWSLEQIVRQQPGRRGEVDYQFAQFLRSQFGVQTMQRWGIVLPRFGETSADPDDPQAEGDESGPYAVHTLEDQETIARLAIGVKRFRLPDEFHFIAIYKRLAASDERPYAEQALTELAQIYEDRQQYPRAAERWRENIRRFQDDNNRSKQQRLDQIVGNWGRFDDGKTQPARRGATLDFRFRNGRKVSFEAHRIRVEQLIADVKAYLQSDPRELDWERLQIDNLGFLLVEKNQQKYVGERVAQWDVELSPRPNHFDRRMTITTPLQQPGAYLVVGRMADGNLSRAILWVEDTAIVKKPLDGKGLYFVADAVTGAPIAGANVEFFGWRQEQVPNRPNRFRVVTANFAEKSDADGQFVTERRLMPDDMQWIALARTADGRFAHLGFTGVWYGRQHREDYQQTKSIVITDRPVYRPAQSVHFKLWLREARYDLADESRFAGQKFTLTIHDPQGTEILKDSYTTDEYGGLVGTFDLPDDAMLGQYTIGLAPQHGIGGGGHFRVEEYKKPEFEVTIDAPERPAKLGETVAATIQAKYYFGAPVTRATVRYKVQRTPREARWYPFRPWDWLYGAGYWWFTPDYEWYPGFNRWGCFAPVPPWWGFTPDPPELVLDREVEIGPDGSVPVEIDTALAKELHGDQDHEYSITAEVTDASRRTIVGQGTVVVARQPFKVFVWTDRGHYRVGQTIRAGFQARTPDGRGVAGKGVLTLLQVTYPDGTPVERLVQQWNLDTDAEGRAELDLQAGLGGQFRLSYTLTADTAAASTPPGDGGPGDPPADTPAEASRPVAIEGGYVFVVRGEAFDGTEFAFNDLELIADKPEYAPGETVQLLINTNRIGSTVLLFVRPSGGIYSRPPQVLRLTGKSTLVSLDVVQSDMPNLFVEALTVSSGEVHTVVRELIVPPEKRVLQVSVAADQPDYRPGQPATVTLKLTDETGEPFVGSAVLSMYDRAVEYISGGSNVPEIRAHFWKWRRHHTPSSEHNLSRWFTNLLKSGETGMGPLGVFGELVADLLADKSDVGELRLGDRRDRMRQSLGAAPGQARALAMPMAAPAAYEAAMDFAGGGLGGSMEGPPLVEPTVRSQFADTAFWNGDITTDAEGLAKVSLTMPENLTDWKIRTWAMGHGTRVGEAETTVTTSKNVLVRLQAPRFFTERDEVVLSAVVHNHLGTDKQAQVELVLDGGTLTPLDPSAVVRSVMIPAHGEVRVDWRVSAIAEGEAVVTMKALTDEESDAMQLTFPVYVHGMLKTESFSGVIRPDAETGVVQLSVPERRRAAQTLLEVRFSPTLAGAMVDALPYLVDYPYGCTEQTLHRFLPTVITQRILQRMQLDLKAIREKRTNLNAQQLGDPAERAKQWKRLDRNPVFDEAEVVRMVKKGVADLTAMQLSDGGWGWFSGFGEQSTPHTTAVVVHGLKLAEQNDIALVPGVLDNGVAWLERHQKVQVGLLEAGERRQRLAADEREKFRKPYRTQASDIDALVFSVLVEHGRTGDEMQRFLYRDRLELSPYSQALVGLALHQLGAIEQRDMVVRNLDQFLKVDDENQTAYLDLPNQAYWWYWYGDAIEANAAFLRLLTRVNPQDPKAAGLVKYLLNNRSHGSYWKSTRDTAYCIEALAEYLVASGEDRPDMTVEVWVDGERHHEVRITPETLFSFDGSFVLSGEAIEAGPHAIELKKRGTGPLYYNAYLTVFTTEEFITAAGLEIKVAREVYRLVEREGATDVVSGSRGQVIDQAALKYDRVPLPNLSEVRSGELLEVELLIESKNDYEYVVFEDLKAAGCEPVDLRSGYTSGGLGAYVEFRDERVAFFMRQLARGTHSLSYRVRAEVPGEFSALPTKAHAMYAPELKANSDEMKLRIADSPQ
jgi:hypothetical protein